MSSKIKVPRPAKIDREKVTYESSAGIKISPANSKPIPAPAKIDSKKLSFLRRVTEINVPGPASIERAKVSYLRRVAPVDVPRPASIDRSEVSYTASAKSEVPKPRHIERSRVSYLGQKISVLQQNVHSASTPGEQFFPPFEITDDLEKKAAQRIAQYPDDQKRSAVLPLLHEVQHRFGFINPESIRWVADKLDIAPIKVVEVVTFYPGFRQKAPGKFHIRVCRTLSCAMGGSYELMDKLCELTGIDRASSDPHSDPIAVSPCGNYSVEFAECLASCGTAPVCLVNDDFHEGIEAEKAKDLLSEYPAKA